MTGRDGDRGRRRTSISTRVLPFRRKCPGPSTPDNGSLLTNTFISERRKTLARPREEPLVDESSEGESAFSIFERLHQPFLLWFANPEQEFLDKLLREDLDRALAALPEHYRVVVVLADVEGLKYGEIAEALGVPVGTVRSRLARARSALQRMLWDVARDHGLRTPRAAATHG